MAISPSSRFDYVAEFTSTSFGSDEIVLSARSRVESERQVLLGHDPKVRFWSDRVVIMASGSDAGRDEVDLFSGRRRRLPRRKGRRPAEARSNGRQVRLGLAIVRKDELVVALGAVTEVNLGPTVTASNGIENFDVCIGDRVMSLGNRESIIETDGTGVRYDIYVERTFESGLPGVAECASIIRAGNTTASNAAIRGAVLSGDGAPGHAEG